MFLIPPSSCRLLCIFSQFSYNISELACFIWYYIENLAVFILFVHMDSIDIFLFPFRLRALNVGSHCGLTLHRSSLYCGRNEPVTVVSVGFCHYDVSTREPSLC